MAALEFKPAVRTACPQLIALASVSGGGKTFSALLVARGLAGPKGTVSFIDTENGRGQMYADSPGIKAAYRDHPNGIYSYLRMDPPFSPARYIEHIQAAEAAGATVCIVDSGTHEWEGTGGCTEIAEGPSDNRRKMPNWSKAKIEHKKLMNHLLSSPMHIIICLRAREKVKIFQKGDLMVLNPAMAEQAAAAPAAEKTTVVSLGLQPICEKNFMYDLTVSILLDEYTHHAVPVKVPEPLQPLFPGGRMLTVDDGARIRQWNEGGAVADQFEQIRKRARAEALAGIAAYKAYFGSLTPAQKKAITDHEENKALAAKADAEAEAAVPLYEGAAELPDAMEYQAGDECWYIEKPGAEKKRLRVVAEEGEANKWQAL